MSKVMQEHYLVVYIDDVDRIERIEWLMSGAYEGKYLYKKNYSKIIIKTEDNHQQCYYFIRFDGNIDRFIEHVAGAGAELVAPIYLEGNYPNRLINFVLSRCRGGVLEADEI